MRAEFAKVLYVVAKDYVEGRSSDQRGPQAGNGLTKTEISAELAQHGEHLDRRELDQACTYLINLRYCFLKGGKGGKRYQLHEKYTMPTLVLDRVNAKIVLTIADIVDIEDEFVTTHALQRCEKVLPSVPVEEIEDRIKNLSHTIEDVKGYFFPKEDGKYALNVKTVEEERSYLELVDKWGFRTPRVPSAPRRAKVKRASPASGVKKPRAAGAKSAGKKATPTRGRRN